MLIRIQKMSLCAAAPRMVKQPVRHYRNIVKLFTDRGLLQDVFPKDKVPQLIKLLENKSVGIYAGFDPTADSLHIGNLLVLMGLIHAQRSGIKPIAVIGGATGRIGDPSGKSKERPMMQQQILDQNIAGITGDIERLFTNHEKYLWNRDKPLEPVKVINNEDFYLDSNIIDFVSRVGRHFRLGPMLGRTSVKSRLESDEGISFTEFTYQIFQSYDWLRLLQSHDCFLQLGGSDQMGNILAGQDLISRSVDKLVFGLTMPLVLAESGEKFGKSAGTPVWMNQNKTSAYTVYQYMLNQKDRDMPRMLKMFTFLPLPEVEALLRKHEAKPENRYAQEKLAEQVTLLLHGDQGLSLAQQSTRILWHNDITALSQISVEDSRAVLDQAQYVQKLYSSGITMFDFAMSIGCFRSERDALRIIAAGGFYINQVKTTNPEEVVVHGIHVLQNNLTLVRVGKKNYFIVEWFTS